MKTIDEIKNEFDTNGLSVAEWSRQHGFPYQSVQQVLQGLSKCKRGISHNIAVALGLKEGFIREKCMRVIKYHPK